MQSHARMLEAVRLVTIHPIFVHFTIGALPIVVLAYVLAAVKKSARWTFVGDVSLFVTAALTLVTVVFGLLSNAVLEWPAGLGRWRTLHIVFAAAATAVLFALAIRRALRRRRAEVATDGTVAWAILGSALVGVAGWIGGEVLVFHGGMAVKGAADGALAPVTEPSHERPSDLHGAMADLRSAWAATTTDVAWMIVNHPDDERLARIADRAARIQEVAQWVSGEGVNHYREHATEVDVYPIGGGPPAERTIDTRVDRMRALADELAEHAAETHAAAKAKDLTGVVKGLGAMQERCTSCHATSRWVQ